MAVGSIWSLFKKETVFLDCDDQRDLVRSQWPLGFKWWLAYRVIITLYWVTLFIWAFVSKFNRYQWFFFTMISHWSLLIFVFSIILKMACIVKYSKWFNRPTSDIIDEDKPLLGKRPSWILGGDSRREGKCLLQFTWLISNIANVCAILVTINYWSGSGPPANVVSKAINFQIHGINAVTAVLETLLVAQPTFLLHFYQPLLFVYSYVAFTALYYAAGGLSKAGTRAIYQNLDWSNPKNVAVSYIGHDTLITLAIHFGLWTLSFIRSAIALVCQRPKSDNL